MILVIVCLPIATTMLLKLYLYCVARFYSMVKMPPSVVKVATHY